MDYTHWLIIVVAIVVCANLIAWLMRKNSEKEPFTGNVDSSGQTETPSAGNSYNIAPGDAEEAVRALLNSGNKIAAIKHVREQTGLGLKEAKDLVDAMERGTPVSMVTRTSSHTTINNLDDEARRLVATGNLIEAVKLVRAQKNLGLKEAKDYVEGL